MERRWLKVLTVVAIAALAASACSDRSTPVAPQRTPSVATSGTPRAYSSGGTWYVSGGQLLIGRGPTQTKVAILDQRGGKLTVGGSSLEVPANALSGATLMTFTLQTQPYLTAKLYAFSLQGKTAGQFVRTFPVALTLTISYADVNGQVSDPSKLKMAWLEDEVFQGLVPSQVDTQGKRVIAQLSHFSEYSPIQYNPFPD